MTEIKPGTPLPWQSHGSHIYGPERELIGQVIVDGPLMADRDYIVHTANSHPSLIAGLREAREALAAIAEPSFNCTPRQYSIAMAGFAKRALANLDNLLSQEGQP